MVPVKCMKKSSGMSIVDLILGYKKSNKSPILKLLLSRLDELVARFSKKVQ